MKRCGEKMTDSWRGGRRKVGHSEGEGEAAGNV